MNRCRPGGYRAADYYDRGIRVAPEWTGAGGFNRFLAHIGPRPSPEHSLDRIENDGDYAPGNVRWATAKEQQRNRRNAVRVLFRGVPTLLVVVAEITGVGDVEDRASGPLRSLAEQFTQLCADAVAWARAQDIDNEVAWMLWDYGIRGLCGASRERPDENDALYTDIGGEGGE